MNDVRRGRRYWWVHDRCRVGPRARYRLRRVVLEWRTRYQEVGIYDLHTYGRALFLDGVLQSAERDEHRYHEALVHPALLAHPAPGRVLIAGGGEGATLREALRHRSIREAVMAELDRELVDLCRKYLPAWSAGAFDDPRTRLVFGDARRVIERNRRSFDVCICDLTEPTESGASALLYTLEFFRAVQRCLRPSGVVVTQAGALGRSSRAMFLTVRSTLRRVFRHVTGYWARIESFREPWGFLCASDAVDLAALDRHDVARRLRERGLCGLRFYGPGRHERMLRLPETAGVRLGRPVSSDLQPFTMGP